MKLQRIEVDKLDLERHLEILKDQNNVQDEVELNKNREIVLNKHKLKD